MKKRLRFVLSMLVIFLLIFSLPQGSIWASETEDQTITLNLNARAAVLMDADSGRVLYEKDGETAYPMASTTKVMTLMIALETVPADTVVTASAYAASMPEVRLGVREGERYRMADLYYALMLESDNDAAVMIAEGAAGSVEAFAEKMNEKALSLGCEETHFITPNGLDAADGEGAHAASARDMALIMRYAIGNESFLTITQTRNYSFTDLDGKRSFSLSNKNSLFDRMDGVLSGKTGYTSGAGYCYVCAVQVGDHCLIAALLGSGWPPNKNYKWQDVQTLMGYGEENYSYRTVTLADYADDCRIHIGGKRPASLALYPEDKRYKILMRADETIHATSWLPGELEAPVEAGTAVGGIRLYLDDICVGEGTYLAGED